MVLGVTVTNPLWISTSRPSNVYSPLDSLKELSMESASSISPVTAPQPTRPSSATWFLEEWLDDSFGADNQLAPRDRRGQLHRSKSVPPDTNLRCVLLPPRCSSAMSSFSAPLGGKTLSIKSEPTDSRYYREVAATHGIIWHNTDVLPPTLRQAATQIIDAERDSPPLSDEQARERAHWIRSQNDNGESSISHEYYSEHAIPRAPKHGSVAMSVEFGKGYVPLDPGLQTRLPQPRPDVAYGMKQESLTDYQLVAQAQTYGSISLDKTMRVQTEGLLPGFIWELKSGAAGGTKYHAESQCIGGGAAIVSALRTLYEVAREHGKVLYQDEDLISFSIASDGQDSYFNLHWYQDLQFHGQRLKSYRLCEAEALPEFYRRCKNVIDYVASGRHGRVSAALNALYHETVARSPTRFTDELSRLRHEKTLNHYWIDHPLLSSSTVSASASSTSPFRSSSSNSCTTHSANAPTLHNQPASSAAIATTNEIEGRKRRRASSHQDVGGEPKRRRN